MQINKEDFISFLAIKENLDDNSVKLCATRVARINKWFEDKELTKENVEKFFYELKQSGRKNNTLNSYRFVFRHLASYRKDRGLPFDFFDDSFKSYDKNKAEIIIFTLDEIEAILHTNLSYGMFRGKNTSFLNFRYQTMTMFLAYTGCRFGEAAKLKVRNLDISAGKARLIDTKNNENRIVYFTEPLQSRLKQLTEGHKEDDFVFRNSMENKVHEQDFSQDLKRRAKEAGVTKRTFPHNFRHSYITHMIEAGVQAEVLATLTGHKDVRVIYEVYMHLADKTVQEAAMMHPSVRRNVDPHKILQTVKEAIEKLNLRGDGRFTYNLNDNTNSLTFSVSINQVA